MKKQNQQRRIFSRFFKKEKVDLLDQGKISVKELSKIYQVSATAIYKWRKKYSKYTSTELISASLYRTIFKKKNMLLTESLKY